MKAHAQAERIKPAPLGERRQVSVLFADVVGSTAIVEELGEEEALPFVRMLYDRLTGVVTAAGGTVRGFAGDSVMALFGIPDAQEDAGLRACRAALAVQDAFAAAADSIEAQFGVRPSMRVGVSSGVAVMAPVEGDDGPPTAVGVAVNLASRIQTLAPEGGCLICDATRRLVAWRAEIDFHGEHALKGIGKPQKLWRLLAAPESATRFDASLARGLSRYVGREPELATLIDAFDASRDSLQVVDLVAEPGLGKTRLVFEFLQRAVDPVVPVLTGQCSAAAGQTPFHPFLQIVRDTFNISAEDEPAEIGRKLEAGLRATALYTAESHGLLMNLLGLTPPEGALAGLDGVLIGLRTRTLLEALLDAQRQRGRVILRLEDVHWIDSASEDLLNRLVGDDDRAARPGLMVIQTRRPEYAPRWRDRGSVATLALAPLAADDIGALIRARLGVETLPASLVRQVTERAGGNPLFGEEVLSFLLEQGTLRVEDGEARFEADAGASVLPASMQSLLAARIDQLAVEDRALLEAAATVGKRFDPGLAADVIGQTDDAGGALSRLQALDIVHREPGSSDYVFKHVLLRDTVYESLMTARRMEMHGAVAAALEKRHANRLQEVAENLAYHYSRTDRPDLAFTYNAMAGAKSLGVFSLDEAARYFAAALEFCERNPACTAGAPRSAFLADYGLCLNISLRVTEMMTLADKVRPWLDEAGDSLHHVHFLHHYVAGLIWNARYADALAVGQDLTAMAARIGSAEAEAYALVSALALSCYYQPMTNAAFAEKRQAAEAALAQCDDAYLNNLFLAHLGWNAVCRGRVHEARQIADRMIATGASTDDARALGYGSAMQALIAMMANDFETAHTTAREALNLSRAEFERAIAGNVMSASKVPLGHADALEAVEAYIAEAGARGSHMFEAAPVIMLGVWMAIQGRVGDGLRHIEATIARHEASGSRLGADWARLYLCEIYLSVLSGEGGGGAGVLLRNLRSIGGIVLFGEKRVRAALEQVRESPHFDSDGHYGGRIEMVFGLLEKAKKRPEPARRHLLEARRIIAPFGQSPMLARIEAALAEIGGSAENSR